MSSAVNAVRNFISSGWNAARSLTSDAWNSMRAAVSAGVSGVISFVSSLPGRIMGIFSGAGSWLITAGRNIIQGFINGITSMFGAVQSKLSSLTSMLPSWKGPAPVDKVILKDAGQLVMQGFIDGLESQYGAVRKSLQSFTEDLSKDVAPEIAASVSTSFEKARPRKDSLNALASSSSVQDERRTAGTVNITNYYPQAQSDSKTRDDVADGIRLASSI